MRAGVRDLDRRARGALRGGRTGPVRQLCLYAESAESTRILAIGVHPYVTGAAHRIKYFEELYGYINRYDVVHWTGQQIFDWYAAHVPKPACRT